MGLLGSYPRKSASKSRARRWRPSTWNGQTRSRSTRRIIDTGRLQMLPKKRRTKHIAYNANEAKIVEDTKLRAQAMERAIKNGHVDIEAPPENVHLVIRRKREQKKLDDVDREVKAYSADKSQARKEIETGSNLGPMGAGQEDLDSTDLYL